VLANFVPLPIQGVVEDQFLIGPWSEMQMYFSGFYDFLLDPARSWGEDVAPPWCLEHATLRSTEICRQLFSENLLETFLRTELRLQVRKQRAICFDKVIPCAHPRSNYCNHLAPRRHAHGYIQSEASFYNQFDRDYFLTAPGVYADFDGQLAARLARFFKDEVKRAGGTGRPVRVIDLGCGRGSYVETLLRQGVVALGVGGDAVIGRTLPGHGLLTDPTEPLDLGHWHAAAETKFCRFGEPARSWANNMKLLSAMSTAGLPHADALALLRHMCCSDLRCMAYGVSETALGTLWYRRASNDAEEAISPDAMPSEVYERQGAWSLALPAMAILWDGLGRLAQKFGVADWVLSLGIGQHVPRAREDLFLDNLQRHATAGLVLSWGTDPSATNLHAPAQVEDLFKPLGFWSDATAGRELRLLAGVAYGGPRADLLVLRRLQLRQQVPGPMAGAWNLEIVLVQQLSRTACRLHDNFGPYGPSAMWVARGCGGKFRGRTFDRETDVLCVSMAADYKECSLLGLEKPPKANTLGLCTALRWPGSQRLAFVVGMGDSLAERIHAAADHFVPKASVWHGDARLNAVLYKFARRSWGRSQPFAQGGSLALEWEWLWRNEWRGIIDTRQLRVAGLGGLHVDSVVREKRVRPSMTEVLMAHRLRQTFEALQRLGCRVVPTNPDQDQAGRWQRVSWLFDRALATVKPLRRSQHLKSGLGSESAWRRLALAQKAAADLVASTPPQQALRKVPLLRSVLPALQRLAAKLAAKLHGTHERTRSISKQRPRLEPLFSGGSSISACPSSRDARPPWEPNSDQGWYLYRLAALDPSV